jgi:hypothetical protein
MRLCRQQKPFIIFAGVRDAPKMQRDEPKARSEDFFIAVIYLLWRNGTSD